MITIGDQHSAIIGGRAQAVVIRKVIGKRYFIVSGGFDTKGNDIKCMITRDDILTFKRLRK